MSQVLRKKLLGYGQREEGQHPAQCAAPNFIALVANYHGKVEFLQPAPDA
jgi:hypothetical protein